MLSPATRPALTIEKVEPFARTFKGAEWPSVWMREIIPRPGAELGRCVQTGFSLARGLRAGRPLRVDLERLGAPLNHVRRHDHFLDGTHGR